MFRADGVDDDNLISLGGLFLLILVCLTTQMHLVGQFKIWVLVVSATDHGVNGAFITPSSQCKQSSLGAVADLTILVTRHNVKRDYACLRAPHPSALYYLS